jgi:hypothetical protein
LPDLALAAGFLAIATVSGCDSDAQGRSTKTESQLSPPPASAIVCREPVWDFGTVDSIETPRVDHVFRVENTSKVAVEVEAVTPTCGCIVPKNRPTAIGPDRAAEFPIGVNTAGRPGSFQKSVEIRLLTSPPSSLRLSIEGMIAANSGFYTVPSVVNFGRVKPGEPEKRSVKLMRYDGTPVEVQTTSPAHRALRITNITPLDDFQSVVEIEIELDAGLLPLGPFESRISGRTTDTTFQEIAIPVRAQITDVAPELRSTIVVSQLKPGETVVRPLLRDGARQIHIHELTYDGPDFLEVRLKRSNYDQPVVQVRCSAQSSSEILEKLVRTRLGLTVGSEKETVERSLLVIMADDGSQ